MEAWNWILAIREADPHGGSRPIIFHSVEEAPSVVKALEDSGAQLHPLPGCGETGLLDWLAGRLGRGERVILSQTNQLFLSDPAACLRNRPGDGGLLLDDASAPLVDDSGSFAGRVPTVVRYQQMDNHGLLARRSKEAADDLIELINARLVKRRRDGFVNRFFWDFRYATFPELGSGKGSRGEWLERKRDLIAPFAAAYRDAAVIDIGFGDLEATRVFDFRRYRGIDLSEQAVAVARAKRPDWRFEVGEISGLAGKCCDLAICLDVLIHAPTEAEYRSLIENLLRISRKRILVSGYQDASTAARGGIVFFHEPLEESFRGRPEVGSVQVVGFYSGVVLLHVALKGE